MKLNIAIWSHWSQSVPRFDSILGFALKCYEVETTVDEDELGKEVTCLEEADSCAKGVYNGKNRHTLGGSQVAKLIKSCYLLEASRG